MEGWISIYRQIQDNWIWKSKEPFDKRSAWIDLLLMVNHDKQKVEFDNGFIVLSISKKGTVQLFYLINSQKSKEQQRNNDL